MVSCRNRFDADFTIYKVMSILQKDHSNLDALTKKMGIRISSFGEPPKNMTSDKRDWISNVLIEVGKMTLAGQVGFNVFEKKGIEALPKSFVELEYSKKSSWQRFAILEHEEALIFAPSKKSPRGAPSKSGDKWAEHMMVKIVSRELERTTGSNVTIRQTIREILTNSIYQTQLTERLAGTILRIRGDEELEDAVIRVQKDLNRAKENVEKVSKFYANMFFTGSLALEKDSTTQKMFKDLFLFE